ncbi:DUF6671 family protein [Mycolicibacterium psychrotolerans]|uniref:DUF6671 family protein n=1 Tax=Mycolicibacterium psychrotolerans TaxID=216929 RepID=UPI0013D8CDC8|nr:DUF6671 family protein [Mycolicibacterium psychrotolerans]
MSSFVIKPYLGVAVAVGTRHFKQRQLASAFTDVLGARLVVPDDLDTDLFGTFSGEVARTASALVTARRKARLGMCVTGLRHGVASEASYGPAGHEEILLFVDDVRGIEVCETHWEAAEYAVSHRVRSIEELPASVTDALSAQAVIVRPSDSHDDIVKGVNDIACLRSAISSAARHAGNGMAVVEPDLRAHHNPRRQRVLARLGYRLAHRLATSCPDCGAPGFGRVRSVAGLPCAACGSPTRLPLYDEHACCSCAYRSFVEILSAGADPGRCDYCNP